MTHDNNTSEQSDSPALLEDADLDSVAGGEASGGGLFNVFERCINTIFGPVADMDGDGNRDTL